ncbi:MAG: hypothetical protein Udaeo2_10310 [Candidatus Udaeobacter sp.]|nr:MAG: hypothetical protein Udaeo2_10310 [Candidatus Udaeobacter sp.]
MMNVAVFETTHHLNDRVHFANVMKELISQAFACAGAFDQASDINEFDRSWNNFFGMRNLRDLFQARIRHGHNAQVWIDGAKRIIFRRRLMRARDGVKKRRLSDVWKTNNSGAKHDFFVAAVSDGRKRATLRERRNS